MRLRSEALGTGAALVAIVLLGAGCSHIPGMSKATPSQASASSQAGAAGSALAKANGQLDAEVPAPPGFPTDVPTYPKARLTAGAAFNSTGQVAWGMEWETADGPASVLTYYQKQFNQGDWTLTMTNNPIWTGTVVRKGNSHETGTLTIYNDNAITMIALSLVSPSNTS